MRRFVNLRGYTRGLYVDGSPWQELVATHEYPVVETHLTSALEGAFE